MNPNNLDIALKEVFEEYLLYSQVEISKRADKEFGLNGFAYSIEADGEIFINPKTKEEIKVFAARDSGFVCVTGWNEVFKTSDKDLSNAVDNTVKFIGEQFEKSGYKFGAMEDIDCGFTMKFH